jgi:hypothetical protein
MELRIFESCGAYFSGQKRLNIMKEIIIKRDQEKINGLIDYKVIIEDGQTLIIGNGETRKILLDKTPTKVYAKMRWFKSREVTIDSKTTEINLKGERLKSWLAPRIGGLFILITLLPRMIWEEAPIAKTFTIVGLSLILIWTIYAFIIKSDDWILIETKSED